MNQKIKDKLSQREFYNIRSLLGNSYAIFFILLGGREAGKSYTVMEQFVREWKKYGRPFYWLRLSEVSTKKMLSNNADGMVDADIVRKYGLKLTVKGSSVYDDGKKMATVLPLSSMAKDKGVALFDKDFLSQKDMVYNIAVDEFVREKGEKNYFDIVYNLVNQLENIVRSTKTKLKIIFIANLLEEASDVLAAFNFIPETWGRYYLKSKRCVIDYIAPSEAYLKRRKGTVADILLPNASTFTNKIETDKALVFKGRLIKPISIIKFTKDPADWFTVWNSRIIVRYKKEKLDNVVAMRPYLDEKFSTESRDGIMALYDARALFFRDLVTQKLFQKNLELLKPRK